MRCGEVPIGCVITRGRRDIVSRGRNRTNETRNATRHAELEALDSLFEGVLADCSLDEGAIRAFFASCRLYVTVEPCIMCAAALRRVGLVDIYFGCHNERFGGCGSIVAAHDQFIEPTVDPPLRCYPLSASHRKECIELLRHFYLLENERAPVPRKKAKRTFRPVE